jgi:hypothetical protein
MELHVIVRLHHEMYQLGMHSSTYQRDLLQT